MNKIEVDRTQQIARRKSSGPSGRIFILLLMYSRANKWISWTTPKIIYVVVRLQTI